MADTKYKQQKAVLRTILNTSIDSGLTAEETCKALDNQFNAICTTCVVQHM